MQAEARNTGMNCRFTTDAGNHEAHAYPKASKCELLIAFKFRSVSTSDQSLTERIRPSDSFSKPRGPSQSL
jgi:hypothetical protein